MKFTNIILHVHSREIIISMIRKGFKFINWKVSGIKGEDGQTILLKNRELFKNQMFDLGSDYYPKRLAFKAVWDRNWKFGTQKYWDGKRLLSIIQSPLFIISFFLTSDPQKRKLLNVVHVLVWKIPSWFVAV